MFLNNRVELDTSNDGNEDAQRRRRSKDNEPGICDDRSEETSSARFSSKTAQLLLRSRLMTLSYFSEHTQSLLTISDTETRYFNTRN